MVFYVALKKLLIHLDFILNQIFWKWRWWVIYSKNQNKEEKYIDNSFTQARAQQTGLVPNEN